MSSEPPLLANATRDLARFASGLRYEDIPREVIAHLKLCILDGLGAGIYGARLPWTRLVHKVVLAEAGAPAAALWGTGRKASVGQAALANSTAAHGFEMDDIHKESVLHPNSLTVPATFAWAEHDSAACDGRELLAAMVAGCEVGLRVGNAATTALFLRGFHPQGTSGTFVAAAACGRLARLTPEHMHHALGIAGSMASGLMAAQEGAMVKRLHAGRATQGGVQSVMLAREGFTGITDVLEAGYGGFLSSFSGNPAAHKLTAGLGSTWETANIGFKMYPSVTSIHSALDGLQHILGTHALSAESIERIDVLCPHMTYVHTAWPYQPAGVTAAQMNMFYGLAVMALEGRAAADQYRPEALASPRTLQFMQRISVTESAELEARGPAYRHASVVQVATRDGRAFACQTLDRRGSPENPVTRTEVAAKFRGNVAHLPPADASRIVALVDALEEPGAFAALSDILGRAH